MRRSTEYPRNRPASIAENLGLINAHELYAGFLVSFRWRMVRSN